MKAKFGAIVVDGRGKLGGHVFSKNKGGAYVRTKVVPSNPQTTSQSAMRAALTLLSQGWRALTVDQRNSWNSAVGNFQKINALGDAHIINGNSLYVGLNLNLLQVAASQITSAPQPTAVGVCGLISVTADVSDGTIECAFAPTVPSVTAVVVWATAPLSAGVNSPGSRFRIIGSLPAATATGEDIAALYTAKFGSFPPAGSKIFIKFAPVSTTTGIQGGVSVASTIVIA